MRYNDRELIKLSSDPSSTLEGILQHMKPLTNEWYQQTTFKERYFKLISNMLFYFKVNEPEPVGVLVLENAHIAYEKPLCKGLSFAFSITFKVNNRLHDNDFKHIFLCRCEDDVNKWVSTLKVASYEYLRSQYMILKAKISMKTGKDPILDYMRNKTIPTITMTITKTKMKTKKATFHSHVETSYQECSSSNSSFYTETKNDHVGNLIDL